MQTTITLLEGLHYLIWHFIRKSHPFMFSTCAFLYYITYTLQILAQYSLVWAVLKLDTKHSQHHRLPSWSYANSLQAWKHSNEEIDPH